MTDKQLTYYKMDKEEKQAWINLILEIEEKCELMQLPNKEYHEMVETIFLTHFQDLYRGYCKEDGYYIILEDWRYYSPILKTHSKEEALKYYIESIVRKIGFNNELKNRKAYQEKWSYTVPYDGRKYTFELAIRYLSKADMPDLLEEYIKSCTKNMNHHFKKQHWFFNKLKMTFEEKEEK